MFAETTTGSPAGLAWIAERSAFRAATFYFSVDRAAHLDYCDIVFTSVNEELRGERNATEMRNLVTDYTKNFFDHYILQKAAGVESLAYDGVDLIKKTSNK
ncbi:hypothetical protein HNP42_000966 [Bacillus velezensis]|nr:hypothetical protein U722_09565 [Bacillus amyloliquefaciens LFB112]MBB4873557.1 hypothetical protein [Bacillus velezensis]